MFLESKDSPQYCWCGCGNGPYTFGQVRRHLLCSFDDECLCVRNGGEQHSVEYKDVNPMAQVPALVVDGEIASFNKERQYQFDDNFRHNIDPVSSYHGIHQ